MGRQGDFKGGGPSFQRNGKADGCQLQGLDAQGLADCLVHSEIAVPVVSKDGAASLGQVNADLVGAAGAQG